MRFLLTAIVLLAAGLPEAARAEQMTITLSTREIRVDSTFSGDTVTLFGVVERDASTVSRSAGYDVAVLLRGPQQTVVERRKDRFAFIWVNASSQTITAPSVYRLNTTTALSDVSVDQVLDRYQLGFAHLPMETEAGADQATLTEFREALIRLKVSDDLYAEQPDGVTFVGSGEDVFQSALRVPASAPAGEYAVEVYLFSGNALLAEESLPLKITKVGFEEFVSNAADHQPLIYGITCVILALFVGWLGGVIFRRD